AHLLVLSIGFFCLTQTSRAENWPAWRGPGGVGVSADHSIPLQWSDKQNLAWRVPLPDRGNSTPIVWGNRIFLTQATERDNRRSLLCFARADGKLLWQAGVEYSQAETTNGQNPHCSSSPVTDGQRVIALFGSAGIYCYDFSGKELWHRELGKIDSWHGSGSSPIIYDDLCVVNFGPGSNAALIAMNKTSGEIVWQKKSPKAGFNPGGLFALLGGKPGGSGNVPAAEAPATRRTANFAS